MLLDSVQEQETWYCSSGVGQECVHCKYASHKFVSRWMSCRKSNTQNVGWICGIIWWMIKLLVIQWTEVHKRIDVY